MSAVARGRLIPSPNSTCSRAARDTAEAGSAGAALLAGVTGRRAQASLQVDGGGVGEHPAAELDRGRHRLHGHVEHNLTGELVARVDRLVQRLRVGQVDRRLSVGRELLALLIEPFPVATVG